MNSLTGSLRIGLSVRRPLPLKGINSVSGKAELTSCGPGWIGVLSTPSLSRVREYANVFGSLLIPVIQIAKEPRCSGSLDRPNGFAVG